MHGSDLTTEKSDELIIRDYIVERVFDNNEDHGLEFDSPLLEWGILNSLQVLNLIDFLEEKFSVKIDSTDLRPNNLATINAIASMLRVHRSQVQ